MANPEMLQALLMASVDCPICLMPFGPDLQRCDPLQCNFHATCRHTICVPCGRQLLEQRPERHRCPICRADFSHWLPGMCGGPLPVVGDLYVIATSPGLDGLQSFRLGSFDDLEQIRDDPREEVSVLATFPGLGGLETGARGLAQRVHRLLEGNMITTVDGVDWFRATPSTVLSAIATVMREMSRVR